MSFDWMESTHQRTPESVKRQASESLRDQARLLRRLGYDVRYTTMRCLQNLEWQYDGLAAPLKASEVKKLVAAVYH